MPYMTVHIDGVPHRLDTETRIKGFLGGLWSGPDGFHKLTDTPSWEEGLSREEFESGAEVAGQLAEAAQTALSR